MTYSFEQYLIEKTTISEEQFDKIVTFFDL